MVAAALGSRARAKGRTSKVASLIADHLLTVTALAAGVTDAFLQSRTLGLAVLVPALAVLDFKLQG